MATLSAVQLAGYFGRIHYPQFNVAPSPTLESLKILIRHHISHIPFENLTLHYSTHRKISLDIDVLYTKFVEQGRGGYCCENNTLFAAVLRGLGFKLASVGAKVWRVGSEGLEEAEQFGGWGHMTIIVYLPSPVGNIVREEPWLVDVGFGSNGPVVPILIHNADEKEPMVVEGVVPEQHRTFSRPSPVRAHLSTYILQHRRSPMADWTPLYIFDPRVEFFPKDYEVMSFYSSQNPHSPFLANVLCSSIVFDQIERALSRTLLQNNVIKRREEGNTKVIEELNSEDDRIKALKKYWGIDLSEEEAKSISGMKTEIQEGNTLVIKPVNLVGFI